MEMMKFIGYPEIILPFLCFLIVRGLSNKRFPTNWPFVGMLPAVILNINHIHDSITEVLSKNGCTFEFRGPWFSNMAKIVATSDPENIRYIFNTNFSNYPKGPEVKEILDFLGDGIFTADFESWSMLRKSSHQLLRSEKFPRWVKNTACNKVKKVLLPVFEHVCEHDLVVDLQDVFQRFTFDTMSTIFLGIDPGCLSTELVKEVQYVKAFNDANEALFYGQVMPASWWKFQRLLQIGSEKKMSRAVEIIDKFIADCKSKKKEELSEGSSTCKEEEEGLDLLTLYLQDQDHKSDKFLRDTMINFMEGGKDGIAAILKWLILLLWKNQSVETKILEELKTKVIPSERECKKWKVYDMSELKELVYLHGALCEALRLYSAVPFELKQPLQPDILPSGHKVDPNVKIVPILYSVGRMEAVWGKDCLEFKPERWISSEGGIRHVPSHKFVPFLSGPRICLGKEVAFIQMKLAAAAFVYNYRVQVVDTKPISLQNSIKLSKKGGLKAKVKRRFT